MKFFLRLVLIGLGCYYLPTFMPWWSIFIISALVGYLIPGNGFNLFNAGFLGGGIVWLTMSFVLDAKTNSILTDKIIQLFPFNDKIYLILITALIGALSAGFGALTGNSFRQIFLKKKTKSLYS